MKDANVNDRSDPLYTDNLHEIHKPLLRWYDREARTLPWRSLPTPYRVWVSEIMLQQTRVDTVLPYFERFMTALPSIVALADAEEDVLLKLWEGLGYYSRVRNLQKAARIVMQEHGGALPGSPEALAALPGIGDYTAGAIASIAFGQVVEAVDGNVLRVMARLTADPEDVGLPDTKRRFRTLVRGLIPADRPGDFNQALMDLGATVCVPNAAPLCDACPLIECCEGFQTGVAADLPVIAAKRPRDIRRRTVFLLRSHDRVLLVRRPPKGLLAGLWELPGLDGWLDRDGAASAMSRMGASAVILQRIDDAKHIFTHVEWLMQGWLAEVDEFAPDMEYIWAGGDALRDTLTLPSAFKAYGKYLPG